MEVNTNPARSTAPRRSRAAWCIALLLLAIGQVLWVGYEWGAGNQGIQIPFLKTLIEPGLYPRDAMVTDTLPLYPSWFFRLLAAVVPLAAVPDLYWVLQLLTAAAVLGAVFLLGRAVADDNWTGLVAVLLLVGGHHRSLTGEEVYLRAFTHTWATFPLAIAALVLFYRERHRSAWAVAGVLFNFHALTSVYLAVLLGFGTLGTGPALPWRRRLVLPVLWLLLATPTLIPLLLVPQAFDQGWIGLTRIRSLNHTFLAGCWQTGNTDVPRFLLVAGAAVLALSYQLPGRQRGKTIALLAGAASLVLVGWLGSGIWPEPTVLRAQLFRSSRLVLVALLVLAAHGIASAWRWPFREPMAAPPWRRWLEFAAATVLVLCLGVPPLLPWLPVAVALATLTAVVNARLSPLQALAAGAVLVGCLAAHRLIAFPWLGWEPVTPPSGRLAVIAVAGGLAVYLTGRRLTRTWLRRTCIWSGLAMAGLLVAVLGYQETIRRQQPDPWVDVQRWARANTPRDALFLTPIQPGGFRIESERSVVGEWRDGTQLFFAAGFAGTWWPRMTALQPGLTAAPGQGRLLAPGQSLAALDDSVILELCRRFGASHVVLPSTWSGRLVRVYRNPRWSVYRPELPAPSAADTAAVAARRNRFLREIVLPNIAKYRQDNLTIQAVDDTGRPLRGARFRVRQASHRFHFSGSLPFFAATPAGGGPDFRPPPVTKTELERYPEVFNSSLIPYSGKWLHIEPEEGQRRYADLDAYVGWCATNNIAMEYHFVSGYAPSWLNSKSAAEKAELFLAHARDLVTRYGSRIEYWQVVNEKQLLQHSPAVFQEIRRLAPHLKLGISDCSRFCVPEEVKKGRRQTFRGLQEIRWLKEQGVPLDFFGFHGHRPFGVWPEPWEMYEALDLFAREGVKIHITEFGLPLGGPVVGSGRAGTWTPELQAEFYEYVFTVCFSHPAVELMNLWGFGPDNWQKGAGLLDEQYQPKPAFHALRRLIHERWHTDHDGTLGLDGSATVRGYHGDYELRLDLADGQTARVKVAIEPGRENRYRFRLDRANGMLVADRP